MRSNIFVQAGGRPGRRKSSVVGDYTIGKEELLPPHLRMMVELSEELFETPAGMHIYFYRDLDISFLKAFGWAHMVRQPDGAIATWIQISLLQTHDQYPILLTIPHEFKHIEDFHRYGRTNEHSANEGEWRAAKAWWKSSAVPIAYKRQLKYVGGSYHIDSNGIAIAANLPPIDLKV